MLFLAGITITFFLAIILLSKKGKSPADHVLVIWLGVIGFHLLLYYGHITGKIYEYPFLLGVQIPMPLLQGPLLYIYTRAATGRPLSFQKSLIHFAAPAVAYGLLAKYFMLPSIDRIQVYKNDGAGYQTEMQIILWSAIVSGFLYVVLSLLELTRYRKRINEEYSNTERINMNWLTYLIGGILGIWIIILFGGNDPLIFGTVVLFVIVLGYFGVKHVGIFSHRQVLIKEVMMPNTTAVNKTVDRAPITEPDIEQTVIRRSEAPVIKLKYEKSALQKDVADRIYKELVDLMKNEKIFKNEELSLAELAQLLNVHPNNLSQVINTYENKSFYDYINTLRVEEFKALTLAPENKRYTLLSLAFECGFNSKTSFNRNFKKISGQSPSAYLKEMNVQFAEEE